MAARKGGSSFETLSLPAKAALGVLLVVLTAAFYFIVFYTDVDREIASAESEHARLTNDLKGAREAAEVYQKDLEEKARRVEESRELKKVLPDEAETPAFLSALQNTASISGVELLAYSPAEEEAHEFYAKVPMSLKLSGRFHQLVKFFHGVSRLDRIINIENIQISVLDEKKSGTDEADVKIEVDLLATAFRALNAGDRTPNARVRGRQPAPAPKKGH